MSQLSWRHREYEFTFYLPQPFYSVQDLNWMMPANSGEGHLLFSVH